LAQAVGLLDEPAVRSGVGPRVLVAVAERRGQSLPARWCRRGAGAFFSGPVMDIVDRFLNESLAP